MSARAYQPPWRRVVGYTFLVLLAVIFIAPFVISVATSFKTEPDATANPISLIPHPPTVSSWQQILGIGPNAAVTDFPRWFMNSVFVSTAITLGRVFFDSLAGYSLARLGFRGRKLIFGLVVATLAVPGVVLLIPRFLVLKELHLFNSYPGMILPMIVDATGIFLMRQFFLQVPVSLEEAAKVDGASILRTWWSIVLPIVRPGLITLTIISFQGSWNEFQFFEVATISPKYYTLTTGLADIVGGGLSAGNQFPLKLGASVLTILPIAILFFVLSKYIVRPRLAGAVKG
jgi:multiple sugar transport system permease protein